MISVFKTQHKKQNNMAYQVANYPAVLRYKTPKSYWQAMRLGLYQTVLNNTSIIQTRKSFITKKLLN